jgi:flagellar hook protein FlgE
MLRSLFSGVSGLDAHQQMLDVIGNNIANVNTTGFKSSSTQFEDILSQQVQGAGAAQNGNGGTNPIQVGLGVRVAGTSTDFSQGALQTTGRSTDMAIQGDGFFVVKQAGQALYTRAGSLSFDATGRLVNPDGAVLQGWLANGATHVVNPNGPTTDLIFPQGQIIPSTATADITVGGNLPPTMPITAPATTASTSSSITVYDSQGNAVPVTLTFTYDPATAPNPWKVAATDAANVSLGTQALAFSGTGNLTTPAAPGTFAITGGALGALSVKVGLQAPGTPLVSFGGTPSATAISQDGAPSGTLQSFSVASSGTVSGVFSNGQSEVLGQVALADFNNPMGLDHVGGSLYRTTANSGIAQVGVSGTGARGLISSGTVEMSNVDLAAQFTQLIVAQRGFEANTKVIHTSDTILQDLINLIN